MRLAKSGVNVKNISKFHSDGETRAKIGRFAAEKWTFVCQLFMHMHFFCYSYDYESLIFGAVILFDCAIPLNYKAVKLEGFTVSGQRCRPYQDGTSKLKTTHMT